MSKTNAFEDAILKLIFQNVDIANIGDAAGLQNSLADGSLYIVLLTADPGDAGSVAAEATYTGYARKAVARGTTEWGVSSGTASNNNSVTFDPCTGLSDTITHFGVATAGVRDIADLIYHAALSGGSLAVSNNITPEFAPGVLTIAEG